MHVGSTVTTANSVFYAGAGPEFVLGAGAVRPYIHGSAGASWFVATSHRAADSVFFIGGAHHATPLDLSPLGLTGCFTYHEAWDGKN